MQFRFCVNVWNIYFEEIKSFVSDGNLLGIFSAVILFRDVGDESFDDGCFMMKLKSQANFQEVYFCQL